MKKFYSSLIYLFFLSSCSMIGGPDGYFPDKKYDFLEEEVAENISIPNELDSPNIENHYPVNDAKICLGFGTSIKLSIFFTSFTG